MIKITDDFGREVLVDFFNSKLGCEYTPADEDGIRHAISIETGTSSHELYFNSKEHSLKIWDKICKICEAVNIDDCFEESGEIRKKERPAPRGDRFGVTDHLGHTAI